MHPLRLAASFVLALTFAAPALRAQSPADDAAAIRATLVAQTAAWNRGDIPAFMQSYEDSSDTTFVGTGINKGFRPILERYEKAYATRAQMGTLSFTDIDVRLLPPSCGATELAIVTGRFHLERSEHGASAKDDGIFSLVWRKGPQGWKIILDHTS